VATGVSVLNVALLLLAVAAAVSVIAELLRFPYTIALVITGLVVGNLRLLPPIPVTPEVLLTFFIPPLLFEGGLRLPPEHLRSYGWLVGLLAIPGTVIAAFAIGGTAAAGVHLDLRSALLLGAIASAIDPVSVIALIRETGLDARLGAILEGEAVLNDGVAIVLFTVIAGGFAGGLAAAAGQFLWLLGGGLVVGTVVAAAVSYALRRTYQASVEALGSLIAALASFVAAAALGVSGVVAVVVAGVVFGSYGLEYLTDAGRDTVCRLWDVVAFLANSVLFLLIGFAVPAALLVRHAGLIAVVILTALAVRAVTVYGFSAAGRMLSRPIPAGWRALLTWSGLRGGVAIALVLGLPPELPGHDAVVAATFGLVVFTLLGQGLSVRPLARRVGLT
jgi:monovalent cation:H+ antiporter, CPA1 family